MLLTSGNAGFAGLPFLLFFIWVGIPGSGVAIALMGVYVIAPRPLVRRIAYAVALLIVTAIHVVLLFLPCRASEAPSPDWDCWRSVMFGWTDAGYSMGRGYQLLWSSLFWATILLAVAPFARSIRVLLRRRDTAASISISGQEERPQ